MTSIHASALLGSDYAQTLRLARARVSFPAFFTLVGRDRKGRPMAFHPRLRLIDDTVTSAWRAGRHVSIIAPPGEGKSTYGRLRLLWELGRAPLKNFAIVSAEASVARMGVSFCRSIIAETHDDGQPGDYRRVFPEVIPDFESENIRALRGWRMHEFYIRRGVAQAADPVLVASPAVAKAEARRLDHVLFDDVMTRLVAQSRALREITVQAVYDTWLEGRLIDAGAQGLAIFLQNCWHIEDLGHRFLGDSRVTSLWIGVNDTSTGFLVRLVNPPDDHPLLTDAARYGAAPCGGPALPGTSWWEMPFPENDVIYNTESLRERERAKPSTFNRQFRHRAVSDGDLMLPSWQKRVSTMATAAEILRLSTDDFGRARMRVIDRSRLLLAAGLDLSSRKRAGNWLCVVARDNEARRVIVEHRRGAWSMSELARVLAETYERLPWHLLLVEDVGVQDQLLQALRDDAASMPYRHTIVGFTTSGQKKHSEEIGLPALDISLSNGTYVWPEGELLPGAPFVREWQEFTAAVATMPRVLPPGTTPDGVMAWWFADRGLTQMGSHPGDAPGASAAVPPARMADDLENYGGGDGSAGDYLGGY